MAQLHDEIFLFKFEVNHSMDDLTDMKNALTEEDTCCGLEFDCLKDGSISFKSSQYKNSFMANLKEFHETEKFCDIVLKTKQSPPSKYIRAHKVVLASASAYFKAMFTGGFKEDERCKEIVLDQISFSSLVTIIDFIYSGEIVIKESNVQNLLPASKMLQIEPVEDACCKFLSLNMDANNCIGIEEFARLYGCVNLVKQAQTYMSEHFCDIIQSDEYMHLSQHQMCKLLSRDELSVRCESFVFRAVVDWVKFDPENRRESLDHLFQCVRFHFLPPKYLKDQIKMNDIFKLKNTEKCRMYMQNVADDLIAHKPCPSVPRKPVKSIFALYVIGGYQRQSINLVECIKNSGTTWENCAEMKIPRSGICCVSTALYIFAIGGRNNSVSGNTDCADVECYDPFINSWKACAPMSVPRSRAGAGVIDGYIYVVGGAHGPKYHSSLEKFSAHDNRWEIMCPMNKARIGLGCAVVNRFLYAVGGYDGTTRLSECECYNPDLNSWSFVSSMNTPRSGAGVCALESSVFAVGGYTTNLQLNTAERYDTIANQWTYIASMSGPRSALAAVAWNGRLICLGGYNGTQFVSTVEMYDTVEDKWQETTALTSERSGHGVAVTVTTEPKTRTDKNT